MTDNTHASDYVRTLRQATRSFMDELLARNQQLEQTLASQEADRLALAEDLERLRLRVASLEHERESTSTAEQQYQRLLERFRRLEQRNSNLANLYVASHRLHGTADRTRVLAAIREIVVNLVGSEEVATFELMPEGDALTLVDSEGVDRQRWRRVALGEGPIGRAALRGNTWVKGRGTEDAGGTGDEDLTACIPLVLDGQLVGAIAVFRLLAHKPDLVEVDFELFDLLSTHAAAALRLSALAAGNHDQQPGEGA